VLDAQFFWNNGCNCWYNPVIVLDPAYSFQECNQTKIHCCCASIPWWSGFLNQKFRRLLNLSLFDLMANTAQYLCTDILTSRAGGRQLFWTAQKNKPNTKEKSFRNHLVDVPPVSCLCVAACSCYSSRLLVTGPLMAAMLLAPEFWRVHDGFRPLISKMSSRMFWFFFSMFRIRVKLFVIAAV